MGHLRRMIERIAMRLLSLILTQFEHYNAMNRGGGYMIQTIEPSIWSSEVDFL